MALSPDGETERPLSRRETRRAETIEDIKRIARKQLSENGTGGISLRAITREMRMSSAAIFNYFPSQSDLITTLCVDAYESAARALDEAVRTAGDDPVRQIWAAFHAARSWALAAPAEFALIAGTPIPGHAVQSGETGEAAGRTAQIVGALYLAAVMAGDADPGATGAPALEPGPLLSELLGAPNLPATPIYGIVMNACASANGAIAAEVFGSLTGLISDTDRLYDGQVLAVMRGMGFTDSALQRCTS
ncbi:TetR/AcrR family transcriptional regulator [Mycobacteroides chelonae]|uniref:TetR/AcrR family transcriptional regulator n=1 Tax=Mycobacteroides chelonae TaxID=1774 RepID=UPI0008A9B1F0|nr:TetR/AcrR family transcriptional regulator [Mycobacteroides chelonae]OHU53283.1 hypothetical protein BKG81_05535 [Mycobacteroides chelonae]